jgi:transposase
VVEQRNAFREAQESLNTPSLVFIDEAGVSMAMSYNYGWAPPGQKPVIERPVRGKNVTLIGAIALDGPRALRRVEHTVNGEEFVAFLREDLGPALNPGDIVVLDGPSIHRVAGVAEALAEFDASLLYLPAYSPELNPIEEVWSWVKTALRKMGPRRIGRLRQAITKTWNRLTAELCAAWIEHSGYTVAST